MKLTKSQKKYLKKNIKLKSIQDISTRLNVPVDDLEEYLKEVWGKEKFNALKKPKEDILPKSSKYDKKLVFSFLAFLISVCYINSLGNDFVSDDIPIISANPEINQLSYIFGPLIFNIRNFSIFLINKLFGLNPMHLRLVDILLHLGTSFMIFILVSILVSETVGLITASIFATHPLMSEAVSWISGGPYVYTGFLISLMLYFYLKGKENKRFYYLSLLSFAVSVNILIHSAPLAFLIPALEISRGKIKTCWKKTIPYLLIILGLIPISISMAKTRAAGLQAGFYQDKTFTNPLLQIPTAIGEYLRLIFWPKNLTLYHTELSFNQTSYLLHLFIFTSFILLIFFLYKKRKPLIFWPLLFLIALSPTLTPLGISWVVAERYCYLASVGIFVLIAWVIDKMVKKLFKRNYEKALYLFLALIIIPLSIRTIVRNKDWKSHDTLWIATAKLSPSSPQNHNNLGDYYGRHKEYEKALEEFKKAIELKPGYADAYHNLANTYGEIGDLKNAITNYENAIKFNPNLWQSYQNLGVIYFHNGDKEKAKEYIEKALEINPYLLNSFEKNP
ncbi:MAG: tetratricopeptide repeat protein [Patescibacteria group bacterium]